MNVVCNACVVLKVSSVHGSVWEPSVKTVNYKTVCGERKELPMEGREGTERPICSHNCYPTQFDPHFFCSLHSSSLSTNYGPFCSSLVHLDFFFFFHVVGQSRQTGILCAENPLRRDMSSSQNLTKKKPATQQRNEYCNDSSVPEIKCKLVNFEAINFR